MIKFFRNIRQKLISEGKLVNYFKYAIGEILLVVIGILIALQINNWNETRKDSKFEKEILTLIDQNLVRDSLEIRTEWSKAVAANTFTDRLMEDLERENFNDSINYWLGSIISFERFKSQSSGFEVLKSRGIGIVKNKNLQIALISYYDVDLTNLYQSLNDVLYAFNSDWIPIIKTEFSDFQWLTYAEPRHQKEFLKKPTTSVLFKLYQDNREGQVRKMITALEKITLIRSLINKSIQ